MEITKVKVYPYKKKFNDVVGVGQVTFDDCLLLTGLELIVKENSRYIRYPRNINNRHKLCFCQPLNKQFKQQICDSLFAKFDEIKNGNFYNSAIQEIYNEWQQQVNTEILNAAANNVETCISALGEDATADKDN